ncbi:MAG: aminopeptidase P family protein [Bacteroidota bacterium]
MSTINNRIQRLRKAMQQHQLDAYIVPSSDAHQSEYVNAHWKSRAWISGFTGSAGLVIITQNHAGLWTDSRYFLQAETELADSEMVLHRQGVPHAPEHNTWLRDNLPAGATIGIDGQVFSLGQLQRMKQVIGSKNVTIDTSHDLFKTIWEDRPSLPLAPILEHDVQYAGQSRIDKIATIRKKMQSKGVAYHLVTTLDDIAWIFNIRGTDVDFNPLALAYAVIGLKDTWLFIAPQKVPTELGDTLKKENITLLAYSSIQKFLLSLPKRDKILINPATINIALFDLLTSQQIVKGYTISTPLKAVKNSVEISHLRKTMAKDGVALLQLYRWLMSELNHRSVTEYEVGQQLVVFRSKQGEYRGESFPAIVGYQGNGAIVHYRPSSNNSSDIKKEGILLLDSGGQYEDGTTDITRTFALGTPTDEQRTNYTLVLKGHIALSQLVFPKGTKGVQIDALARQHLWQHHLNYGHGTGHGVGFFLNVHEGPQSISPNALRSTATFEPGMLTSNEPGFYKTGEYGIRIENLVLCVEAGKSDFGTFYQFDSVSLFPYDPQLIDVSLLTAKEIDWINTYHQKVKDSLSPLLKEEERVWLEEQCKPIL